MIDTIIDLHHANGIDFAQVKAGGIVAVIHKASEGHGFHDPKYMERRAEAKAAGLLWGAYHYSSGDPAIDQVQNFLAQVGKDPDVLLSLDWEHSRDGPDMTIEQAREFVTLIRKETGRWPLLYGGNVLRTGVGHVPDPILACCPLWYARYRDQPIGIPTQIWPRYTLWQYTDGAKGTGVLTTQGVSGADRSRFDGTEDQLREAWPLMPSTDIP